MDGLTKHILDYVRENPGVTTPDILAALPSRYSQELAWFRIVHLSHVFEIENRGGAGRTEDVRWHILEWEPTEFFLEFASDTLRLLKRVPLNKQKLFLARQLQQFAQDRENRES